MTQVQWSIKLHIHATTCLTSLCRNHSFRPISQFPWFIFFLLGPKIRSFQREGVAHLYTNLLTFHDKILKLPFIFGISLFFFCTPENLFENPTTKRILKWLALDSYPKRRKCLTYDIQPNQVFHADYQCIAYVKFQHLVLIETMLFMVMQSFR